MSEEHRLQPESGALKQLAAALQAIGAAANEADRRFETDSGAMSKRALEKALREVGYRGGMLDVSLIDHAHAEADTLIFDTARFADAGQAELAWEQDHYARSHAEVERRVEDWLQRLSRLRSQMEAWATAPGLPGLSIVDRPPATMSEKPMRRFGVRPREMPVFEFRSGAKPIMRVLPKGLWIIGANGRIDLITRSAAPILVDRSEPLSQTSDWQLYDPNDRHKPVPLTAEAFEALLRAGLQ